MQNNHPSNSQESFNHFLLSHRTERPLIVEIYADTSGACCLMNPLFEEVIWYYERDLDWVSICANHYPILMSHFSITRFPTLICFWREEIVQIKVGILSKQALVQLMENLLKLG